MLYSQNQKYTPCRVAITGLSMCR